jgi:hypothetical protein
VELLSSPGAPVALRVRGKKPALEIASVSGGKAGASQLYRGRGELIATAGAKPAVSAGGKAVRSANPDRKPPVTTASFKVKGSSATVRLSARDDSGVAALNVLVRGKRLAVKRGVVRVPVKQLAALRFGSVDTFGNAEKLKELKGAPKG